MADLRIAHLPIRQADIMAAGVQEGTRPGGPEAVEARGIGLAHGIVRFFLPPAPAIEDNEHDGLRNGHDGLSALWFVRQGLDRAGRVWPGEGKMIEEDAGNAAFAIWFDLPKDRR
ncbi:hypothetical protein HMPREF9946_00953 [Acetobacteraceae bacterium AT-5844]|nr:hypothetical protein HMPREF9946_00953 [Acetobacteraceae bacterium AT-5844]